jgi:hypothetical protein
MGGKRRRRAFWRALLNIAGLPPKRIVFLQNSGALAAFLSTD